MDLPYPVTPADFDTILELASRADTLTDSADLVQRIADYRAAALTEAEAIEHVIVELREGGRGESNFVWRCKCGTTCGVATLNRAFAEKSADEHLKEAVQRDTDRIMWEAI